MPTTQRRPGVRSDAVFAPVMRPTLPIRVVRVRSPLRHDLATARIEGSWFEETELALSAASLLAGEAGGGGNSGGAAVSGTKLSTPRTLGPPSSSLLAPIGACSLTQS